MKNKGKKGISLVTLVITIIVIIILAAAVILTLNNNNPIENAKEATFKSDVKTVQSELTMYISKQTADTVGGFKAEELNLSETTTPKIEEVLTDLSDQEQQVLRMRFGLDDDTPKTLEEIGKVFGVTRERIRQIEAKAIRKLRHPSRLKLLKNFY